MTVAVAYAAPPPFTTRHGDRRFRLGTAAALEAWRAIVRARGHEKRLRSIKPRRTRREPLTARPSGHKPIPTHWVVHACALERFAAGRGPCPVAPRSKKYEPVPIVWSELSRSPALRIALERVAEALSWSRTLGEEGEKRLVRLNQRYKRWTRQRATEAHVVAEANTFVAFVEAAPRPAPFVEPTPMATERTDAEALIQVVRGLAARAPAHVRKRLEDEAITEALLGRFDPTDSIETRARRSIWRVEARVRRESRRGSEKSCRRNGCFESEPF